MQPDALIPRSKEWWKGKADWNAQEKRWTFPCGATITFGYLERDDDVYQYQGAAYQFVGIDELTQHTEFRYRYLFSRLRRRAGVTVPLRMRAGSNPGGRGHEWVKKRFLIDFVPGRVFVPALLADNPSLDAAEYERSLAHLDPITRAQLLRGDWEAHVGGRFKPRWLRYYSHREGFIDLGGRLFTVVDITNRFLTVDTAATVKKHVKDDPDWTVVSAWGMLDGKLLWLGCVRFQVEVPDIAPRIWESYHRYQAGKAYVEGNGVGKGPAQLARRYEARPGVKAMNIIEVTTKADKLTNAANAMNMAEAGRLWLPLDDPAFPLEEVQAEVLLFTGDERQDAHDDIVDTLSTAANKVTIIEGPAQQGFRPYTVGGR